jgi:hypothetical protein
MANSTETKRVATTRPDHRRGMTRSQIRNERRRRSENRKKRRRTVYLTGGTILAVIFILSLTIGPGLARTLRSQTADTTVNTLNTGGPVPLDPDDGRAVISTDTISTGYSTKPATSGEHWLGAETPAGTSAPARWGIYDVALPDEVLVKNLENGGIGLHYNCPEGCDDVVAALQDVAPSTQYVISPYPDMESKITITAWRHHLNLDTFDRAAIADFINAYLDRAPDSVTYDQF